MASQVRNGKAFEWAIGAEISNTYGFKLQTDDVAKHNKSCYDHVKTTDKQRDNYRASAKHAVKHILEKEKLVNSKGTVKFLPDKQGEEGDVRDLVISIPSKTIGISCKTNHQAFKHSRLSKNNDFVK